MKNFKNFKQSTKLTPEQASLRDEFSIEFCVDEKGGDWYDLRSQFSEDTLKFTYDGNGLIHAASTDASMLRPLGLSVAEIDQGDVPDDFGAHQINWLYKDGKIVQEPVDNVAIATRQRDAAMSAASSRITELSNALEDDDISEDEKKELVALRAYRSELRKLDLTKAPDIKWPEKRV